MILYYYKLSNVNQPMQNSLPAGGASPSDKLDEGHGPIGRLGSASVRAGTSYELILFILLCKIVLEVQHKEI